MRLTEVFIPGGQPKVTYVSRSRFNLERQLLDYIDTAHTLLSITGPTKSGKTVLCRSVVNRDDAIWLDGGTIVSEDDLWTSIIDACERFTEVGEEASHVTSRETSSSLSAEARIPLLSGGGEIADRSLAGREVRTIRSRSKPLAMTATSALMQSGKPLIIDDFHYIDRSIQTRAVRALKQPIFDGVRVIVLAVPHRAYDAVRVEKEMTGRVTHMEIKPWTADELREIPASGFTALNVTADDQTIGDLINQSFNSPFLMQSFCQKICLKYNIRERSSDITALKLEEGELFFSVIAKDTSKPAFDRLATGPRQRGDRMPRRFADGPQGDIYIAVLRAIARTGPRTELSYEDIRAKLREILADEIPQAHEISRVLTKMTEIAKEKIDGEPVLEWDEDGRILHIADPFFAFYLRWGQLVRPGSD